MSITGTPGKLLAVMASTVAAIAVYAMMQEHPQPPTPVLTGDDLVLHEPVQIPEGYGFEPVAWRTTTYSHGYESTEPMTIKQAQRGRAKVMAYYVGALRDWIEVGPNDSATLIVKDPDSTLGVVVSVTMEVPEQGPTIELGIRALYCLSDQICH